MYKSNSILVHFPMTNRKLNYVDGQLLKAQETKIPHGGWYIFSIMFSRLLRLIYLLLIA